MNGWRSGKNQSRQKGLENCAICRGTLVYPVEWQERDNDQWWIRLRCPECHWDHSGTWPHSLVERFDMELNRGTDKIVTQLEIMERASMERDIELIVAALDAEALIPEDF